MIRSCRRRRARTWEVRWPGACSRCGGPAVDGCWVVSHFDMAPTCLECHEVERQHPAHAEAVMIEILRLSRGDTGFQGVGLPEDLRRLWLRE